MVLTTKTLKNQFWNKLNSGTVSTGGTKKEGMERECPVWYIFNRWNKEKRQKMRVFGVVHFQWMEQRNKVLSESMFLFQITNAKVTNSLDLLL